MHLTATILVSLYKIIMITIIIIKIKLNMYLNIHLFLLVFVPCCFFENSTLKYFFFGLENKNPAVFGLENKNPAVFGLENKKSCCI